MVIRKQDRVSTVLRSDASLVETFVALSPAFERLRNPAMRRVMSRLVTVAQAARMAGVDADELVDRLNAATSQAAERPEPSAAGAGDSSRPSPKPSPDNALPATPALPDTPASPDAPTLPARLAALPADRVVTVDVREDLLRGQEPFSRIMAARRNVPPGGALRVRAIFEPVPLYAVMAKQGLSHHTERLAGDDWRVWFYDEGDAAGEAPVASEAAPAGSADADARGDAAGERSAANGSAESDTAGGDVIVLDVRGLEPPEPMVRTLAALESLPDAATLVQINVRVPRFLLPLLDERGFAYEIREQEPDLVRVFIRRAEAARSEPEPERDSDMPDQRTLDVRVIPPREKHPAIFETFAALAPGESFVLVNDHDPKPLRYQFQFEHEGEFGWEYLEQGPTVWRVQISRSDA